MKAWVLVQADELRERLEAEMKAGRQEGALRQMSLIMAGLMRGQLAVALQAMRMNQGEDRRNRELEMMQAEGEAQLRSAAIREMRAVMMRLAKGEVAVLRERGGRPEFMNAMHV